MHNLTYGAALFLVFSLIGLAPDDGLFDDPSMADADFGTPSQHPGSFKFARELTFLYQGLTIVIDRPV